MKPPTRTHRQRRATISIQAPPPGYAEAEVAKLVESYLPLVRQSG